MYVKLEKYNDAFLSFNFYLIRLRSLEERERTNERDWESFETLSEREERMVVFRWEIKKWESAVQYYLA